MLLVMQAVTWIFQFHACSFLWKQLMRLPAQDG
ncbi:hypothetical protein P3T43_001621 [Paraburkholderia sp. GAS41]